MRRLVSTIALALAASALLADPADAMRESTTRAPARGGLECPIGA